ncbi:glucose-6-phosphate isomerase [Hyphomicrobiales bacterium]|jgi:glucose-6-phosphate isomerase|nr:glucose-6-phosphate isomerase [Hyphomicrobiales bacterium]MDC3272732.1 glucose-6-phosphate isomerase [Hyphomicrobiales bacterium]
MNKKKDISILWEKINTNAISVKKKSLKKLFEEDKDRFKKFSIMTEDLLLDFSKENIDQKSFEDLIDFIKTIGIKKSIRKLFNGEKINITEEQSALHTLLRYNPKNPLAEHTDKEKIEDVLTERNRMLLFAENIRSGIYLSSIDKKYTDILHIGVGGSSLGPKMVINAMSPDADGPNVHFISNLDGSNLSDVIESLSPTTTLIIIASKSFTTHDTLINANSAIQWLRDNGIKNIKNHIVAITNSLSGAKDFGINEENIFKIWDWVGGRFSLWSSMGLPIAIAIGTEKFIKILEGANEADDHFLNQPIEKNIPILMGLIAIWRRNIMNYSTTCVVPYEHHLSLLPSYLQQLEMESNGKTLMWDNSISILKTSPIIWGGTGTEVQHSFFQLMHQGTDVIPVDFLIGKNTRSKIKTHHNLLVSNCIAQSRAMAFGSSKKIIEKELSEKSLSNEKLNELTKHMEVSGNKPSTTYMFDSLTPKVLGKLIAYFEHKVFVMGCIWNINSFDQLGVELGKKLAQEINEIIIEPNLLNNNLDSSSAGLIANFKNKSS